MSEVTWKQQFPEESSWRHSCCWWAPPTPARFARFPLPLRCEDSASQEGVLLLSHGVKRSGGGWEGVVSNNGTLSRALVRFEG